MQSGTALPVYILQTWAAISGPGSRFEKEFIGTPNVLQER